MLKPKFCHRLCNILRFPRVKRMGQTCLDVAKGTGPCAGVPHDHHGRMVLAPALTNIGAARLLAHGVEVVGTHNFPGFTINRAAWSLDPYPVWLAQNSTLGLVGLFRVPKGAPLGAGLIVDCSHNPYI